MNYRGYNKHIKRTCGNCRAASMSAGAQALYVKRYNQKESLCSWLQNKKSIVTKSVSN